ncbi:MAG: hypothetical protein ACMUEM_07045 [Flavobacteriales bacterium AspAUS03]
MIENIPDLNPKWLITGHGLMLQPVTSSYQVSRYISNYSKMNDGAPEVLAEACVKYGKSVETICT